MAIRHKTMNHQLENQPIVERLLKKLEAGKQVTIVALGDSNTELTFHTRGCLNWVGLLQVALYEKHGNNKVVMINAGCSGDGTAQGLARLDRDVLRHMPDLVIICFWDSGLTQSLKQIVHRIRAADNDPEILLRTPNPVVVANQPETPIELTPGKQWPGSQVAKAVEEILSVGRDMNIPVVDHYHSWLKLDTQHLGPPVSDPKRLWLRMSDAYHPGPLGHIAFYRELSPYFRLSEKLPWE